MLLGIHLPSAWAGHACKAAEADPDKAVAVFNSAAKLKDVLDNTGQKLVVIARRGQNLEKYGIDYSHAAFALNVDGVWNVYHELNKCDTADSALYVQGLAEFLADNLISFEVAIVIPPNLVQSKITALLISKDDQLKLHEKHYSAVAYPFSTEYQNSNGWVVETYARAESGEIIGTREQAQSWLKTSGYKPSTVELGMLTRLGARMFEANVAFDDQPPKLRWNGIITTSTGDSILNFVSKDAVIQKNCDHGKFSDSVCLVPLN
jgi:hypothetical protein